MPLRCKFRVARMTTYNGGPLSSRRLKNTVPSYYIRVKYIEIEIKRVFFPF